MHERMHWFTRLCQGVGCAKPIRNLSDLHLASVPSDFSLVVPLGQVHPNSWPFLGTPQSLIHNFLQFLGAPPSPALAGFKNLSSSSVAEGMGR